MRHSAAFAYAAYDSAAEPRADEPGRASSPLRRVPPPPTPLARPASPPAPAAPTPAPAPTTELPDGWAEVSGVYPVIRPSRDELIQAGLPLVRRIAFRLARRLPPNVEVGDLIGAGTEGLLKAVDRYDATRHPSFQPYAEARIRGAILDELRAADSMTRHGRRRLSEVSACIRRLEAELGRAPEEEEIARALGMTLEQYQHLAEDLARGPALARLGENDPDDLPSGLGDPSARAEERELRPRLVAALQRLPERTQTVLALYYQEECTQAEIGKILGVTESRVCQILGEAAARLRAILEAK